MTSPISLSPRAKSKPAAGIAVPCTPYLMLSWSRAYVVDATKGAFLRLRGRGTMSAAFGPRPSAFLPWQPQQRFRKMASPRATLSTEYATGFADGIWRPRGIWEVESFDHVART